MQCQLQHAARDWTLRHYVLRYGCLLGVVNLCEPHPCPCGAPVDARGTHGLSCKRSPGGSTQHHQLNDLIWRALGRASVPSVKEPNGLLRSDGKRPDGVTLILWQAGRCLAWDSTVVDTFAASYIQDSSMADGSVAEGASERKDVKYSAISQTHFRAACC